MNFIEQRSFSQCENNKNTTPLHFFTEFVSIITTQPIRNAILQKLLEGFVIYLFQIRLLSSIFFYFKFKISSPINCVEVELLQVIERSNWTHFKKWNAAKTKIQIWLGDYKNPL